MSAEIVELVSNIIRAFTAAIMLWQAIIILRASTKKHERKDRRSRK